MNVALRKGCPMEEKRIAKNGIPVYSMTNSHSHGFLYLYQPIIEVSINGFTPQSALRKQQQLCRSCVSPAQGCGRSTLPWVSAPTNIATL